jgi:hypothetical protein
MYDRNRILTGLAIFGVVLLFPFWFTAAFGRTDTPHEPVIPPDTKSCVLDGATMRADHMNFLNGWRDQVVRQGGHFWTAPDGRTFEMSLTKTCLSCHRDKALFCDRCHLYADVKPDCFNCHNTPRPQGGSD